MYNCDMTNVLAKKKSANTLMIRRDHYCSPKCGNILRKIARAVEGCWYNLLKVVPGKRSRYSKEASEEDMLNETATAANISVF